MIRLFLALLLSTVALAQTTKFAAYSLTMGTPNLLNVFSGDVNAQLTLVQQVATGGNGVPVNGPGIQSQDSLIVYGNYIFAVNPTSNTLSLFSINTTNPTQVTLVGAPASTGGDWPLSVTAFGTSACVVTSGVQNILRCFTFGPTGLTVISGSDRSLGLNLTNPPVSHTGPAQVSFTPDGRGLVVSIKGANPPVLLFPFGNGAPGATAARSVQMGNVPFGFTFDVDGTVVLTDAAPTGTTGGVILLGVNPDPNTPNVTYLSQYFVIPNQNAACWVSRSNQTGYFYTSNVGSGSVSAIARTGNSLSLVASYQIGNSSKPLDSSVFTLNGVDYLLLLSGTQQLFVVKLGGGLSVVQTVNIQNTAYIAGVATYVPSATTTTGTTAKGDAGRLNLSFLLALVLFICASML